MFFESDGLTIFSFCCSISYCWYTFDTALIFSNISIQYIQVSVYGRSVFYILIWQVVSHVSNQASRNIIYLTTANLDVVTILIILNMYELYYLVKLMFLISIQDVMQFHPWASMKHIFFYGLLLIFLQNNWSIICKNFRPITYEK